jgi:hypothetical protein
MVGFEGEGVLISSSILYPPTPAFLLPVLKGLRHVNADADSASAGGKRREVGGEKKAACDEARLQLTRQAAAPS